MSVPFSNTTLRIPRGFGNLLEGLSREVLRHQPKDIIEFAAIYFEDLLEKREATGIDPADWAAKLEDRFYNNHVFKEVRKTIPDDEEKQPPVTIDTAYQEKDLTVTDKLEDTVGSLSKCIKVPKDLSFISKETISMIIEDSFLKGSKHAPPSVADVTASLSTQEPGKGPQDTSSIEIVEASPGEGQGEIIAPLMIEAAPEEGQGEVATPLMIEAAPEELLKMEETSQIIDSAPEAVLPMETPQTGEPEEQAQSSEEHPVVNEGNPEEEHAAVLIQSTFRGYSTRKKLKEDQLDPTQADNDLFGDGSEYISGEEFTFAEEETADLEAAGVIHEEFITELEDNGSTARDDIGQINICATELDPMLDNICSIADVDICSAELQPDTNKDNKWESEMTTEAAREDICGTELDQKNSFEPALDIAANVDICDAELAGLVAEKDTNDTEEGTEIDLDPRGGPSDQVTDKVISHYEVEESETIENPQDLVDKILKSTRAIEEESDAKSIESLPTAESQDAEGGSSTLE
ncbi:uncharacterized protein [Chiloscyllium punctatum]|uniref:uncharacterized protein n=1 Tax=Chiloscyllium punctatum TaxID=137246 RepID=UPI003B63F3D7